LYEFFWKKICNFRFYKEIFAIALALLWSLISVGLHGFEGSKSCFRLNTIVESKVLLIAIIFLGRYLFFSQYRNRRLWKTFVILFFLGMVGAQTGRLIPSGSVGFYFCLLAADAAIWSVLMACLFELVGAVFKYWCLLPQVEFKGLYELWQRFWDETLKFGLFSTLAMSLAYYYLVSFYLVDTVLYSYILFGLILAVGIGLYSTLTAKLHGWTQQEINLIDQETGNYLGWQKFNEGLEFYEKLPRYQYLLLTRDYLTKLGKPVVSLKIVICYLLFGGFLLILPYVFGIVVEVNSFK
jgi:hypothetical protein